MFTSKCELKPAFNLIAAACLLVGILLCALPVFADAPILKEQTAQEAPLPSPSDASETNSGAASTPASSTPVSTPPAVHQLKIQKDVVDPAQDENLTGTAAKTPFTLLRSLFGASDIKSSQFDLAAERDTGYGVCGFIFHVSLLKSYITVGKVFPTMPAAQAQLQPGDVILSVNGMSTRDIPFQRVWDYFTGTPGTEVNLLASRQGTRFTVTLKRMDIGHIPDVATRRQFLTIYNKRGPSIFQQQ